jgi:hypothetical protein
MYSRQIQNLHGKIHIYRFITHKGVIVANAENIWKTKLPLESKIFLCQLAHNKHQAMTGAKLHS